MSVANTVSEVVARARVAQAEFETFDQAAIDNAVCALAWVVMEPGRNRLLAEQAVADTSLGSVEDKVLKNYRKTLGLLRDLKEIRTVGVIAEYPELGLTEIARPVGVVGAVTPSTNPVATPTNKVINAVKGGNAVILAPSPKGRRRAAGWLSTSVLHSNRLEHPRTSYRNCQALLTEKQRGN